MTEFCRTIAGTPGTEEYEMARALEGRDIWYSKSHGFIGCVNPQAGSTTWYQHYKSLAPDNILDQCPRGMEERECLRKMYYDLDDYRSTT